MPKDLGTESITRKLTRSVDVFQVTARPSGDIVDIYPLIEHRNPDTDEILSTEQLPPQRFNQDEIELAMVGITELPETYQELRIGIAKLMHAMLDTR